MHGTQSKHGDGLHKASVCVLGVNTMSNNRMKSDVSENTSNAAAETVVNATETHVGHTAETLEAATTLEATVAHLMAELAALKAVQATTQAFNTQLAVGTHVSYKWQNGSEHTGTVAKVGRKWTQIINDDTKGRKDAGLDWIFNYNVLSVLDTPAPISADLAAAIAK
jgi:hypothetical protein